MTAERCQHRFWNAPEPYVEVVAARSYKQARRCKNKTHWSLPPGVFDHLNWFCAKHRPGLSPERTRERDEQAQRHREMEPRR